MHASRQSRFDIICERKYVAHTWYVQQYTISTLGAILIMHHTSIIVQITTLSKYSGVDMLIIHILVGSKRYKEQYSTRFQVRYSNCYARYMLFMVRISFVFSTWLGGDTYLHVMLHPRAALYQWYTKQTPRRSGKNPPRVPCCPLTPQWMMWCGVCCVRSWIDWGCLPRSGEWQAVGWENTSCACSVHMLVAILVSEQRAARRPRKKIHKFFWCFSGLFQTAEVLATCTQLVCRGWEPTSELHKNRNTGIYIYVATIWC